MGSKNRRFQDMASTEIKEFTMQKIVDITNDFRVEIGSGGFSKAYKGMLENKEVAVKLYYLSAELLQWQKIQIAKHFYTEMEVLKEIKHDSVVAMVAYAKDETRLAAVYDLLPHSLDAVFEGLNWKQTEDILRQVAGALLHLHKHLYAYNDLKPQNIMLNEEMKKAKIIDFGAASKFDKDADIGTVPYADPGRELTRKGTVETDVYSFGYLMLQLMMKVPSVSYDQKGNQGNQTAQTVRTKDVTLGNLLHVNEDDLIKTVKTRIGCSEAEAKKWRSFAMSCCGHKNGRRRWKRSKSFSAGIENFACSIGWHSY